MKKTVRQRIWTGKKWFRFAALCFAAACAASFLSGCSIVNRVKYEFSGSEAVWEQTAQEAGIVSEVEEYYYNHLPETLHEAYREIYVHLMQNEDSGDFLTSISVEDFWTAYYAVLADHPEIFWIASSAQVEESNLTGTVVTYQFDVTVPVEDRPAMKTELEAAADACIAQIPAGSSDYEKIKSVYEYIINTTEYDSQSRDSQNIQSALLYHSSVCAGYSKAFQYILHRMGLFCTYVTGTIVDGGDHGWNMVRIADGGQTTEALAGLSQSGGTAEYYFVDVTWGDPVFAGRVDADAVSTINYNYLCCTGADLFQTHVPDGAIELPECNSDAYNYYKMNGYYYETYDYATIYDALMTSVQNGDSHIVMKFGSQEGYAQAQTDLFEGDLLSDAGQYLMQLNGVTTWNYRYHTDDNFYLITIYWS